MTTKTDMVTPSLSINLVFIYAYLFEYGVLDCISWCRISFTQILIVIQVTPKLKAATSSSNIKLQMKISTGKGKVCGRWWFRTGKSAYVKKKNGEI